MGMKFADTDMEQNLHNRYGINLANAKTIPERIFILIRTFTLERLLDLERTLVAVKVRFNYPDSYTRFNRKDL